MEIILNKEQIHEIIPHRYEMSLLDDVVELSDDTIVARMHLKDDTWFFRGHFPSEPVMPGVLQVEALAQAGCIVLLGKEQYKGKKGYFTGINNVKFKRKVLPNETLTLKVEMVKIKDMGTRGAFGVGNATASVGEEVATTCEISFFIG